MQRFISLLSCGVVCFLALAVEAHASQLNGKVRIDGSSTVFPITEAVAEEFKQVHPRVRVTVGVSGTGGGFKKFVAGETDINDASRPIKSSEAKDAKAKGIAYIELPVAFDGLSVVVHPENTWAKAMTVSQLKKLWQPGSQIKMWSDLNPKWPKRTIKLYGPGPDSGTFDYFTEAINGKSGACRSDYQKSEDDNMLVQGVSGDKDALGFFGYAYFIENSKKLKAVAIDNGKGAVLPSEKTINDGSYAPLSRRVFIYVGKKASERVETKEFVNFYLKKAPELVKQVGYVPLPTAEYTKAEKSYSQFVTKR